MRVYYNEIDPYCCAWLKNLTAKKLIPAGDIDGRDIRDVCPDDLRGYDQCHFFAGVAGWVYALELAGEADRSGVWTGSCPCQPFSVAGQRKGVADERHLWPAWFSLIRACRPELVFGEQVEAAIRQGWLDAVFSDMEAEDYACGAVVLPACSIGAPHIRQRLWFVADANGGNACAERLQRSREQRQFAPNGRDGGALVDAASEQARLPGRAWEPGNAASFWSNLEWIDCVDGKRRPTKSPFQFMADGLPRSLGRVRTDIIENLEKEMTAYAETSEVDYREAVFDLWCAVGSEAFQRPTRRFHGVRQAPVLFAFLRQLAAQGWAVAQGFPQSREEIEKILLRGVRSDNEIARASYRRRLDEQLSNQHPDAVRVLSSILARYAQEAWGETIEANAVRNFPLARGVSRRVDKLRAFGNAIVPQVAAAFIRAVLACRP